MKFSSQIPPPRGSLLRSTLVTASRRGLLCCGLVILGLMYLLLDQLSAPVILPEFVGSVEVHEVSSKLESPEEASAPWIIPYLREMKMLPVRRSRKQWEYALTAKVLNQFKLVEEGRRGLGFSVGPDSPLASYFVEKGCKVTIANSLEGKHTSEHHDDDETKKELLRAHQKGIVAQEKYLAYANFIPLPAPLDITLLPESILQGQFDFVWSTSFIEHLDGHDKSKLFIEHAMKALKPGGVAVHTTEFDISTLEETRWDEGHFTLFLKKDFEEMSETLAGGGNHLAPLRLKVGEADPSSYSSSSASPFSQDVHRMKICKGFLFWKDCRVYTSAILVIEKGHSRR